MNKIFLLILVSLILAMSSYAYEYHLYEDFSDPLNSTWIIADTGTPSLQQINLTGTLDCAGGTYGATVWLNDSLANFSINNDYNITIGWYPCKWGIFICSKCAYGNPTPIFSRYYAPTQNVFRNETIQNNSGVYGDMSFSNLRTIERWDGVGYFSPTNDISIIYDDDCIHDFSEYQWDIRFEVTTNPNGTRFVKAYRNDTLRWNGSSILSFDGLVEGFDYFHFSCVGGSSPSSSNLYSLDYIKIDIATSNISINATPTNITFECNDSIDNDGDGFIDYPNDPSCDSYFDYTEAPFDIPQCNDGIDNDFDGFTDYPADPSCSSVSDNTESPADASLQDEDACLESLNCLIYDSIPYSDSPMLHGWYGGQVSATETVAFLGGYSMDLKTVDEYSILEHVILYKNISHTNNYNNIEGEVVLAVFDETSPPIDTIDGNEVIIGYYDYFDNRVAEIYLNFTIPSDTAYDVEADIWAYSLNDYVYVGKLYTDDSDNGHLRFSFEFDELSNIYTFSWTDMTGTTNAGSNYNYDQNAISQIHKVALANTLDSDISQVLLNSVTLDGVDTLDYETFCTEWESPYILKENFNGYMSECGWVSNPDIFFYGDLLMQNEIPAYELYRIFVDDVDDAIFESECKFSVAEFDLIGYSDTGNTNILSLYLYDLAFQEAFIRLFFYDDGRIDTISDGDTTTLHSGFATDVSVPIKIHLNLLADTFDLYYNDSLVSSDNQYYSGVSNIQYFNGIYFASSDSHYSVDNLQVYGADSDTNPIPCVPKIIGELDENLFFCGLFTKEDISCNEDNDCVFGECSVSGKCSKFDFTYCDNNDKTRGNMCVISGITSCFLTSTGDIITENFFSFLILLVIIMLLVYLSIVMRTGGK